MYFYIGAPNDTSTSDYNSFSRSFFHTCDVITKSDTVLEKVSDEIKKNSYQNLEYNAYEIRSFLEIKQIATTEVYSIFVTTRNKVHSKIIAEVITETSKKSIEQVIRDGHIEIVESATLPEKPSYPNLILFTSIGALISLIISSMILIIKNLKLKEKNKEGQKNMILLNKSLGINNEKSLTINGADIKKLTEKYGTPLYIMDENLIRENLRRYKSSLEKYYSGNGLSLFAAKAFCTKYMCKIVKEEGLGIDVVSGGELYTALKADFPTEKIYFHGNNKTTDELIMAVENNVGRIVVDNLHELERLNEIAKEKKKTQCVMFRIKPGIDAHTHDFIRTGQIDSKFGFAIETGEAMQIIEAVIKCESLKFEGIHCHIGSQIFDLDPFIEASMVMMKLIAEIKDKFGLETNELNLGGGFGIKYTSKDDPIEYEKYIEAVAGEVKKQAEALNVKIPRIIMEPGRSIVGEAGLTAYTVGAIKEIPNVRNYASVDGGMGDNPRYIMYGSEYSCIIAGKPEEKNTKCYTIAGKCCESGDVLIKDVNLPELSSKDILCVLSTGAYNYSMSSNYNRIPRPAVVMIKDGIDTLIVKRETYEDILRNDL